MLRLMLLRHAKSDWPDGMADHQRPLAKRGRQAAPTMGAVIAREKLMPELTLVSTARRTRETWALLAADWPSVPKHVFDERLYETTAEELLRVVKSCAVATRRLMLVGHNPSLHELALLLARRVASPEHDALARKFPTAALAVIEFAVERWQDVEPNSGNLVRFLTPRALESD